MEFDGCHGNFKIDGHMSDASKFPQRMKDQVLRVNCLFTTMKKPYWGGGGGWHLPSCSPNQLSFPKEVHKTCTCKVLNGCIMFIKLTFIIKGRNKVKAFLKKTS